MSGAGIVISVGDDDREIRRALRRLSRWAGGDMYRTMDEIGAYMEDQTRLNFEREMSPEGEPWEPSGPSYARGPDRAGLGNPDRGKTLQDTRRLFRSITHIARRDRSETGTNVVYAAAHQFGGKTPPRVIRPRNRKALAWPGGRHPVRRVNHPGSKVPRRAFLGVSPRNRRAILDIVGRHARELWR